ncbi:hypothetical protein [Herbidospora sp. NBRC 101105]|uniref:hypothetical protein n=1 Tax=Herbidospora sp. NBRC 101105 TaxID=3032195 RepID=UPI0024A4DE0D|nr:hypothetical protein [Herbidospora sp. NBRC 101105]GLX93900.1 hypothetical protein Hesp01_18500 [Herbidospora sp. NBRC 101105]
MIHQLARAATTFTALLALGACSAPPANPLLQDPAQWPLVKLAGLADNPELPDEAERALAQIKVGSYNLLAWINSSGLCGLSSSAATAGTDVNVYIDLTKSEGGLERPEGFSGPVEPTVSAYGTKVRLFCTPTRMLIRISGETSEPFVSGDAIAKLVNGGLNAVVGSAEAQMESLPDATVTRGG